MIKHFYLLVLLFLYSCTQKGTQLGTQENPVKLYFTPSVDAQSIASNSDVFIKFLEKETGIFFKTAIPASYIAVVEAFGSERADIGVMNSFGYLMANEKYGAQARLTVIRYGEKTYKGQIIANVNSGITKLSDLNGKKFAFTDSSSTSGYLFPLKMINESNVTLENKVFAMKHDNVVSMVYQGQVDAGATYYSPPSETGEIRDARSRVKTQFPDVEEKVKIIALTDEIMNDPFVFRKGLDEEICNKFILAVKKFLATDEGKTVFNNIYSVDGVVDSTDADYNGLRQMVTVTKIDPVALMKDK